MPSLAADPSQTTEISLRSDEALPPERRPVFIVRHLTRRERVRATQLLRDPVGLLGADCTGDDVIDATLEMIAAHLVGWRNVRDIHGPVAYGERALDDILSDEEIVELHVAMIRANVPTAEQAGNSVSPSQSAADRSAGTAPAGTDAETSPTSGHPSACAASPAEGQAPEASAPNATAGAPSTSSAAHSTESPTTSGSASTSPLSIDAGSRRLPEDRLISVPCLSMPAS